MLLAFIVLILVLLHVQFFVRNILFGTEEVNFFVFTIRYLFNEDVARASLYFSTACTVAFAVCYLLAHRLGRGRAPRPMIDPSGRTPYKLPLWPLISMGLLQVVATFKFVIQAGFDYHVIAEQFEQGAFVLELRVIYLLLLSHLLLNVPLREIRRSPHFKLVRVITYLYILASILMQARSRVFEVGALICFSHLVWHGDKLKVRYFAVLGVALLLPNIIVLARLGWPSDVVTVIDGIFSFEYTVLFNNLLSAAIDAGPNVNQPYTFTPSLGLLLPSPVRTLLGMAIEKSDYYSELAETANIRGGGFSLLAELFTNFGWETVWVLGGVGALLGFLNARAMRVGRASMMTSAAPLIYTAFILAFRNDLGVFIKYSIQLLVIALIMSFLFTRATSLRKRQET